MADSKTDVAVLGAGIVGVSAAYAAPQRGLSVASDRQVQAVRCEYGIDSRLLDRQAIAALEPSIVPVYKVGLLHTQTASVVSPVNVLKAYVNMLAGTGGEVRQSEIKAIVPDA